MNSTAVLNTFQELPILLIVWAFVLHWYRSKKTKHPGKKRRRFHSTNYALGIAFQQIQQFVAPGARHTIQEMLKEEAENEDNGGPETPAQHLECQLKRIRRGEQLDKLTTLQSKK